MCDGITSATLSNTARFSVLVVEPSMPERQSLADALSRTGCFEQVVGTCSTSAAKRAAQPGAVNVALIARDIHEGYDGDESAWGLIRYLRAMTPSIPSLAIAEEWKDTAVIDAFSQGAKGVFARSAEDLPRLCKALVCIHMGQVWANSEQLNRALDHLVDCVSNSETQADTLAALSSRERQIADFLTRGATNQRIARALHISERTVKNHVANIFKKIGVKSRVQAALLVRGA